jgi:COPI associated protein.
MSNRLKSILTIADILLGVALIVLGLYRLIKVKITTPRVLFLSLYYLIFGTFLILSITPYEKFKI